MFVKSKLLYLFDLMYLRDIEMNLFILFMSLTNKENIHIVENKNNEVLIQEIPYNQPSDKSNHSIQSISPIRPENLLKEGFLNKKKSKNLFLGNEITDINPKKLGKIRILCYKDNKPFLSIGPDFYLSVFLFILVLIINLTSLYFIYQYMFILFFLINQLLYVVFVISFSLTVFKNPGIPSKDYFLSDNMFTDLSISYSKDYLICFTCNVYVRETTKIGHCSFCKVCIIGYDHHCGWSSKCIGKGNEIFFKIFVFDIFLFSIYNLFVVIYYFIIL